MRGKFARFPERFTPTHHVYKCGCCFRFRFVGREFIIAKGDEWGDGSPESFPNVCRSCHAGYEIAGELAPSPDAPRRDQTCGTCGESLPCAECTGDVAQCRHICGSHALPATCPHCGEDPRIE